MRKLNKMLAAALALAMCAGMVVPAFAVDINQAYIDRCEVKTSKDNSHTYIELDGGEDNTFNMLEDIKTNHTLHFVNSDDITLNMNGHTLDHQGAAGSVIRVEEIDLTINGAGENGEMGTITGGNATAPNDNYHNNGGGIYSKDGDLTVKDVHLTENTAKTNGSAIWAGTTTNEGENSKIVLENVVADNNEVTGTGGGTITVHKADADYQDITVSNNTTGGAGGGLGFQSCGEVKVTDSVITGNVSTGKGTDPDNSANKPLAVGGGVCATETESITMENVTISGNTVGDGEVGGVGGGMYAANCGDITFDNSLITGNQAGNIGGGLYATSTSGETTITTTNNTVIAGNTGWNGKYANDVGAAVLGDGSITIDAGAATYKDQSFDGWDDSTNLSKVESEVSDEGSFVNGYVSEGGYYLTSRWVTPEEPGPGPGPGPGTEIPDPEVPLGPGPDETEIDEPEVPLAGAIGLNDVDHMAYIIGYEDDTVRPLGNITRAEVSTIFFRLMTDLYRTINWSTTNDFSDVNEGDWFNNAVSTCANAGIVDGYADGTFLPNKAVTRAEFAAIVARFLGDEYTGEGIEDFSDTADHWAAEDIRRCVEAGWVTTEEDAFRPDDLITRAEVMTIINRMLHRTPDEDHMLPTMKTWTDNPKGTDYYAAIQEATNEHEYELDEAGIETWTALLEMRDWAALEAQWAAEMGEAA